MAAVVYLRPLSPRNREEFDSLNLDETRQEVIKCMAGCGAEYVLVYPTNAPAEILNQYRQNVLAHMGICQAHQPRIWFNF